MNFTDQDLLQAIRNNNPEAFTLIYKQYRDDFVGWCMKYYQCERDEAREAFQVAVVVLYENITRGKMQTLNSSVKTYLYGVGKNKMREHARRMNRIAPVTEVAELDAEEEQFAITDEHMSLVSEALHKLGEPCQELLELYYYKHCTMEEIAAQLNYKNTDTAKNQKYKCLLRLRKIYRDKMDALEHGRRI